MLAYILWHWPLPEVEVKTYESSLAGFHDSLSLARPKGLLSSFVFRADGIPWAGGQPGGYEDWYLLEGSTAIDVLNETAISAAVKSNHDGAAVAAQSTAGGLYQLKTGDPLAGEVRHALWLPKPRGTSYEEFYAGLEPWSQRDGVSLWRRQMVLGQAPEFCLLAPGRLQVPAGDGSFALSLELLWP